MKKYILLSLMAFLVLGACEKDELGPVLNVVDKPVITSPSGGASVVLTQENAASSFSVVTWRMANFNFVAGIEYTVEMDKAGNNFANTIDLGRAQQLKLEGVTNETVNTKMLSNEFPGEAPAAMELRIAANVNPEVPTVYSDPVAITITPYTVVIDYPKLQVPGSHQGWDPANESTVIFSLKSNGKYEGYINFPNPNVEFKYTDGPSWDTNWGDSGLDGTLDLNGDNIIAADAGLYKLNVNINDLTHTLEKTDWGVIGDATPTGWDSDTDMVYDESSGTLKVTLDLIGGGNKIKFRANDDWALNLGDDDANGDLQYGGADITIEEAGNYTIELILNQARYIYKLTKN